MSYNRYTPRGTHIFVEPPNMGDLIVEYGMHEPLRVDGQATQYQGADVVRRARREGVSEVDTAVRMALELVDPETDWSPGSEAWDDTAYETRAAPIAASIPEDHEIGESAEDWWDALGYATGLDGWHTHPICSFDEIDDFDAEAAPLPRGGPRGETPREAREAVRDLVRYGRAAKEDALTIRWHIDRAIEAARAGDAATMAEELDLARRAEMEYGDEPSTRAARQALLGEGWTVYDGMLWYDPTRV